MTVTENIKIALRAIKGNLLRSIITVCIIAVGITALVAILTAVSSMEGYVTNSFSSMGSNTLTLRAVDNSNSRRRGEKQIKNPPITYHQAIEFKEKFDFPAKTAMGLQVSGSAILQYKGEKTNPTINVTGIDLNYLDINGFTFQRGRNFSEHEINTGRNVVILGESVATTLFSAHAKITGSFVSIGGNRYRVIGVLEAKGSSFVSNDNIAFLPIKNARSRFSVPNENYAIQVAVENAELMEIASDEVIGSFRKVRRLRVKEKDDFEVAKSNKILEALLENKSMIYIFGFVVSGLALLGAAVALMNILLVSVTERTREIGICKALGAKRDTVLGQFLTEAIVICQIGGLVGIFLGLGIGNLVSMWVKTSFVAPWGAMILAVAICVVVGLVAGIYPAMKAAKLDPIDALRYE